MPKNKTMVDIMAPCLWGNLSRVNFEGALNVGCNQEFYGKVA